MFRPHKELVWNSKSFYKCKKCDLVTTDLINWSLQKKYYWDIILVNTSYSNRLTEIGEDYVSKYGNHFCGNPTPMNENEIKHYKNSN